MLKLPKNLKHLPSNHQFTLKKKTINGGTLNDDLKLLAVPFAILLAKQGIEGKKKKWNYKEN